MAYFEKTNITDASGNVINPAEQQPLYNYDPPDDALAQVVRTLPGSIDDQIVLLRRVLKLLETQSAADAANRQRITIDSISAGVTLPTVTTVATVTTVTTVTTVSNVNNVSAVTTVNNIAAVNGWNQQMFADPARTAYNTGIRRWLSFS